MQERVVAALDVLHGVVFQDEREVERDGFELGVDHVAAGSGSSAADCAPRSSRRGRGSRRARCAAGPGDVTPEGGSAHLQHLLVLALLTREVEGVVAEESSEG